MVKIRKAYVKNPEAKIRQRELLERFLKILVYEKHKVPMYKLPPHVGVSMTCLNNFLNLSRLTGPVQLSKIELYILKKERELGL